MAALELLSRITSISHPEAAANLSRGAQISIEDARRLMEEAQRRRSGYREDEDNPASPLWFEQSRALDSGSVETERAEGEPETPPVSNSE